MGTCSENAKQGIGSMKKDGIRSGRAAWGLLVLGLALGAMPAQAAEKAAAKAATAAARARHQQERAVCLNGQSNQDRTTCLHEADAAFAQARNKRAGLEDGQGLQYRRHAFQRCEVLPDGDRQACEARMQGQGTTSGSAAAGGIYRELVLREPASPDPATLAAPSK
jgi:hypothetical protein